MVEVLGEGSSNDPLVERTGKVLDMLGSNRPFLERLLTLEASDIGTLSALFDPHSQDKIFRLPFPPAA